MTNSISELNIAHINNLNRFVCELNGSNPFTFIVCGDEVECKKEGELTSTWIGSEQLVKAIDSCLFYLGNNAGRINIKNIPKSRRDAALVEAMGSVSSRLGH